jgi:hypothetical protein
MSPAPFLPAILFALAAFLWPAVARFLPPRWMEPLTTRAPWLPKAAPWLRSAALPYFAVILGFLAARDFGLMGGTWLEWLAGGGLAIGLGILLGGCLASRTNPPSAETQLLDEARWTLYRAVCWPLVGSLALAVGAGLLIGLAEFGLEFLLRRKTFLWRESTPFFLRIASSSLLFLVAHNFYLAMILYIMAQIARHPAFPAPWNAKSRT